MTAICSPNMIRESMWFDHVGLRDVDQSSGQWNQELGSGDAKVSRGGRDWTTEKHLSAVLTAFTWKTHGQC